MTDPVQTPTAKPSGAPAAPSDDRLWYRNAVIYQMHVRSFMDSNDDGIGDFTGLISRLDYLQDLGVTAIWLLPFYPSPLKDDGYDIADYTSVNASYGSIDVVKRFITEAHRRQMRVITELVINHTSDQHPWFQRARQAPKGSPEREFYVWSDSPEKYSGVRIIFKDFEPSNWTFDHTAGQYYWHRFFNHQPDLNFDNPSVHDAVLEVCDFWMARGWMGYVSMRSRICTSGRGPAAKTFPRRMTSFESCASTSMTTGRDACCWPRQINGRRMRSRTSATAMNAR